MKRRPTNYNCPGNLTSGMYAPRCTGGRFWWRPLRRRCDWFSQ